MLSFIVCIAGDNVWSGKYQHTVATRTSLHSIIQDASQVEAPDILINGSPVSLKELQRWALILEG